MGDLNQRGGHIESSKLYAKKLVIQAKVPLTQMFGYSTSLRSLTKGRATFTMRFYRFDSGGSVRK